MSSPEPQLRAVDDGENLFRAITYWDWWDESTDRPSSAAFYRSHFSANVTSGITAEVMLKGFRPGTGLVEFRCADARQFEYDPRHDQQENEHESHCTVFRRCPNRRKKIRAQELADSCTNVQRPDVARLRQQQVPPQK